MKKLLLLLLICFCANAYAQNGWFLQPVAGLGMSNIATKSYGGAPSTNNVSTYNGGLNIGYQAGKLGISAGLDYLRTGSKQQLAFDSPPNSNMLRTETYEVYFSHILLPICVSYRLRVGNKLAIVPLISIAPSYNLSERENLPSDHTLPQDKFDNEYNRISLFGMAQVNVSYAFNKRVSVFAGPSFSYMLTNMYKVPAGAPYKATQHNYAMFCNAGIQYLLPHKKQAIGPGKM